ncbi:OmpH family outer membrane protein [Rubrivirga sp. S365]|uniref:OmpH family outer membrane protein n=1 Tax=Rubrivirga litoralis TaxID=3075598 RepID=A0ABU3BQL8_9BACT|nr:MULTISPECIES: OmpH family outer membrane protein [unclassified Rubrivirga]MDT0631588.1 OmpH family outer membrane protein [Rubrivirga sp. F394]MDT7857233.1 OmpH family outer membrane protein [Rubrivirga sp. S365]
MPKIPLVGLVLLALAPAAAAQQRVGHVDSAVILEQMPEFQSAQQEVDRLGERYQAEVDASAREADEAAAEFTAREILYTDEERERALAALADRRQAVDALRRRYFGPEGELFREQQQLLRPAQERLLAAVEAVASEGGYDYVFDRDGDYLFLFAAPANDLTDRVLDELGVGVGSPGR